MSNCISKKDQQVLEDLLYEFGHTKPRYPMPAIRHQVDIYKSSFGFRMFTVVYEIPEENAWRILCWDVLMHWY